jgi:hypothetical protein
VQLVECRLCRAEQHKHPMNTAQVRNAFAEYFHPLEAFPRAYGQNVDNGHGIRADNCGIYGVNTGAKLTEHHLSWGWIDEITGARLCCNEERERYYSCSRERFHKDEHRDAVGHRWPQQNHFLLSRIEVDGSIRHLDLYDTQANAQIAAGHDAGTTDDLEWVTQERTFQYHGRLEGRPAYLVTYIDVQRVHQGLKAASASHPSSRRTSQARDA